MWILNSLQKASLNSLLKVSLVALVAAVAIFTAWQEVSGYDQYIINASALECDNSLKVGSLAWTLQSGLHNASQEAFATVYCSIDYYSSILFNGHSQSFAPSTSTSEVIVAVNAQAYSYPFYVLFPIRCSICGSDGYWNGLAWDYSCTDSAETTQLGYNSLTLYADDLPTNRDSYIWLECEIPFRYPFAPSGIMGYQIIFTR